MTKRYLVTGGCGFIGSHLCEALVKDSNEVIVIDDLSTGRLDNLDNVRSQIEFIQCRVEDYPLAELNKLAGVFHLAAQASVPVSIDNFFESSKTNLLSSLKLIEYCSKTETPFVYASSSGIYGDIEFGVEKGSHDLLSPYACDKYAMEIYCEMASSLYGLASIGLRFFNVYGPRQDPTNPYSGVISIFTKRILCGTAITINGGHQTRDFVYIDDVVKALTTAIRNIKEKPGCLVSNVLTGNETSIDDLASILMDLIGQKVGVNRRKLAKGDPKISNGDIRTMLSLLGFTASTPLRDGLKSTIDWMAKDAP